MASGELGSYLHRQAVSRIVAHPVCPLTRHQWTPPVYISTTSPKVSKQPPLDGVRRLAADRRR